MRKSHLYALMFAAAAVAARLPFLISGKIPFDSDEAVEGLMARHLLQGEFPAFFWGQAFKGVPEVYAAAGVFAIFDSSVIALKSVTLAFFAAYVALNFILLDRIASRAIAAGASLVLIAGPPALVYWTLDASAEYVVIMLLGTILLLLCLGWQRTGKGLAAMGFVAGLGLWTHQLFAVYLIPLALIAAAAKKQSSVRDYWLRFDALARPAVMLAAIYFLLGATAFLTGGFSFEIAGASIGVRAPQKLIRLAVAIGALAILLHLARTMSRQQIVNIVRRYWMAAAGFLIGYLPVVLYSVLVEPARSPARSADLRRLVEASPDIFGNVIPIFTGFKMATTERLPVPIAMALPMAAVLAAYLWATRGRFSRWLSARVEDVSIARDFFPLFVMLVPILFIFSGAYLDTQSYRYLIPYYAGLSVALAAGSLSLTSNHRELGWAALAAVIAVFGWQQMAWYQRMGPDSETAAIVNCLRAQGIRGGFADYWTSYKITFVSKEEIIVAPNNGLDRYPAYTEFVRALPADERRDEINAGNASCR